MASPLANTSLYAVVHVHVPAFLMRQVLVKVEPPAMTVLSGMVTSVTNSNLSQGTGMEVELGFTVLVASGLVDVGGTVVAREVWVAAAL
jgi:DUF1009 family protein